MLTCPSRPSVRQRRWLGPTGLAIVAALAGYVVVARELPHSAADHANGASLSLGYPQAPVGVDPFVDGGKKVTLAQATDTAGFTITTPSTGTAGPSSLSDVWMSPIGSATGTTVNEVVLDYVASGVEIDLEPASGALAADPANAFQAMVTQDALPSAYVTSVLGGAPAFVIPPNNGQVGSVEYVSQGVDVTIMGHQSAPTLLAIANSMS